MTCLRCWIDMYIIPIVDFLGYLPPVICYCKCHEVVK